jgi:hypothetical protein
MLQGLQKSNCRLERLILKEGLGQPEWQALIDRIPRFRSLKTLDIRPVLSDNVTYLAVRDSFIHACHVNGSLEMICVRTVEGNGNELREDVHDNDFDSIVTRNRGLKRFRGDPTTLPLSLWNKIFVRATQCDLGHDLIYHTLRGQVESQWWNQGSNKRRRIARPPE